MTVKRLPHQLILFQAFRREKVLSGSGWTGLHFPQSWILTFQEVKIKNRRTAAEGRPFCPNMVKQ